MADFLPSPIEPLGDAAELEPERPPGRAPKAKSGEKPQPVTPPLDSEPEEEHQLDEQA